MRTLLIMTALLCFSFSASDAAPVPEAGELLSIDGDDDSDGWPDLFDRCPYRFDPSNQDLDRDGLGDACDPDPDGDDIGLGPQAGWRGDTCPFVADPGHPDRD